MLARALLVAVAVTVPALGTAAGDEKPNVHEGKLVRLAEGKLVMTDKDGKNEHSHFVAKDMKVTLDGRDAKPDDLKPGHVIRVTTGKRDDKVLVIQIEARKVD